jgi:hypothetical protein
LRDGYDKNAIISMCGNITIDPIVQLKENIFFQGA